MNCELCGKDTELFTAVVEGTQLKVCTDCGRFGKILRKALLPQKPALIKREPALSEHLIADYGQRIRKAREQQMLTQQEFAQKSC